MKNIFTKILAILGTVLVLLPVLAPFIFGLISYFGDGIFRFDYLLPAELGLVILVGAVLLLADAVWTHLYLKLIGWAMGVAIIIPIIGQIIASVTGLASGETEPGGWEWALVLASLAILYLAVIALGTGGVMLTRALFKTTPAPA
jgi:hypothetical protein